MADIPSLKKSYFESLGGEGGSVVGVEFDFYRKQGIKGALPDKRKTYSDFIKNKSILGGAGELSLFSSTSHPGITLNLTNPTSEGFLECGRASVAWSYDSKGNIKSFPAYVARVTDKGLLVFEAVTYATADENAFPPAKSAGTVAADSIKLSHKAKAPMYELGPECVANGNFANGLDGWSETGCDVSVVDGRLKIENITSNPAFIRRSVSQLDLGDDVRISYLGLVQSGTGMRVAFNNGAYNQSADNITTSSEVERNIFAELGAAPSQVEIIVYGDESTVAYIDGISARKAMAVDFTMVVDFTTPADWYERGMRVLACESPYAFLYTNNNTGALYSYDGSQASAHGGVDPSTRCKIAMVVSKDGGTRSSVNGRAVMSGPANLSTGAFREIFFGSNQGQDHFLNSHIHDFKIIEGALSDAELMERSAL